ncbi:MAG: hypothetical protein JNK37_16235 [Verrucomicrobiales bacterium]|nr:hypothetical protein [Verrucomicrobiales bacterium]
MRRRAAIIGIGAGVILAAMGWLSRTPPTPAPSRDEAATVAAAPGGGSAAATTTSPSASEQLMRLGDEGIPELSDSEIEAFVESRQRDATSLIAALYLSGDPAWLDEAAERFPDRPEVALAVLMRGEAAETQGLWIERLKRNDPENAVGHLFAARQAFADGDSTAALSELASLADKPRTQFYMTSVRQAMTDAYRQAGHGDLTAEWSGMARSPVPASELRSLGKSLATAMETAHAAGDPAMTQQFGQIGLEVARRVVQDEPGDFLITRLIGLSLQRQVLHQLDVFELVPGDRQIVADRLIEMDRDLATLRDLTTRHAEAVARLSDTEAVEFTRRLKQQGEFRALRWLAEKDRS